MVSKSAGDDIADCRGRGDLSRDRGEVPGDLGGRTLWALPLRGGRRFCVLLLDDLEARTAP